MAKKNDETKKEVAPVKQKKEVSKKEPAKVLAKKLPKIYKKEYTEKAFEKKLLKHLINYNGITTCLQHYLMAI